MGFKIHRYHDISCGHTVTGHEGKCINLHGHNYRFHFTVENMKGVNTELDEIGRVVDFSVIKKLFCEWLEKNWDHRFLVWEDDPRLQALTDIDLTVVEVPFNPTAENMAQYFVETIAPKLLDDWFGMEDSYLLLSSLTIEETRKCSVTYG